MKEILMLKKDERSVIGLTSLKRKPSAIIPKAKKKVKKEMKISDLMRRA